MSSNDNLQIERNHYQTLQNLKEEQWQIKYLYDRLSIVDNKTSALMRVNGVMMGFVTVATFRVIELKTQIVPLPGLFLLVSTIIFISLFVAEIYSFSIFYLKFDRINNIEDFHRYKDTFFTITIARERKFRRLRNWSFAGAFIFSILFTLIIGFHALKIISPDTFTQVIMYTNSIISSHAPFLFPLLK